MGLTIKMISDNFAVINELFFDNELITPRFEITHVKSYLGQYHWRYDYDGKFIDSVIRISDMFDRSDDDIVNTIAHECIHLYIRQNHIKDTRPHHGKVFNSIADRLNREGGFHIARTDSIEGCGLRDKSVKKTFYIACYQNREGRYFRFRMNKNYIDHYKRIFEYYPRTYQNPIMFTSTDDKAFAHCRECRKGVWGKYITKEEFDFFKETEDVFYRQQTLGAA